jgi:hypothetical protein
MLALVFAALLTSVAPAAPEQVPAEARSNEAAVQQVETTRWYGWQTMLPDAAALGLGLTAYGLGKDDSVNTKPLALTAVALYLGGAPALHFIHGNATRGIESVLLRLGLPVAGGLLGGIAGSRFCHSTDDGSNCFLLGAAWGLLGGAVAASALDATLIAREPAHDPPDRLHASIVWFQGRDGQRHPAAALAGCF